ncbi:MAG: DUF3486 family protein [Burkholderia gladioli]
MPPRSKIAKLPPEIKAWLDKTLVEKGFGDYDRVTTALNALLEPYGMQVGRSGVAQYGKSFDDQLKSLRLMTEQARAVVQASPDDEGEVNDALTRLVQQKLFSTVPDLYANPDKLNLAQLAKAVAELGRSSVLQKRWRAEARKQAMQEAAKEAGQAARELGLTQDAVEQIQARILGKAET